MNIEDLTIKEAREIASIFQGKNQQNKSIANHLLGKYVIVRSRNEGVNAGFVKALDQTGIVLTKVKRLWKIISKDKDQSWYEGVSNSGLADNSMVSSEVEEKAIIEDYSITLCTETAQKSIMEFKPNKTSC